MEKPGYNHFFGNRNSNLSSYFQKCDFSVTLDKKLVHCNFNVPVRKFVSGSSVFLIMLLSPLMYFTYYINNILGFHSELFRAIFLSPFQVSSFLKYMIAFIGIIFLGDWLLLGILFLLTDLSLLDGITYLFPGMNIFINHMFLILNLGVLSLFFSTLKPIIIEDADGLFSFHGTNYIPFSIISILLATLLGVVLVYQPEIYVLIGLVLTIIAFVICFLIFPKYVKNNASRIFQKIS